MAEQIGQLEAFNVREVNREDSKKIWEIRNHPLARKNFNNPEEIPWKNHESWFEKKYFSRADNHCFVLLNGEEKIVGYCRFDFDEEKNMYVVSIAINHNNQGKGLGNYLLRESLQRFASKKDILAEIRKGNIYSIRVFQKNNFRIYKEDARNYYLKYGSKEKFKKE